MGLTLPLRPDDSAAFRRDSAELIKALRSLDDGMQWYAERTSPYPLAVTERDVAVYDRLYAAIATGIEHVVQAYWSDARIRAILALPPPLLELLARTEGLAYRTGALRPDFLCDADGAFRICEVNARFPTNGFMCSYYTNEAVDGLAYLAGCPARSVPGLRRTLDVLTSRFRTGEPLVVLLDREQGTEVFLLVDELRRRGIDARCRRPAQLLVRGGRIVDGGDVVEQFILELERDELLDLPVELFDALAASERSFNDVRTLLLGHDKRMLAVLSRPEIMVDHVGADELEVLARHVIPTFHAADPVLGERLVTEQASWVLKRNSSGRGIGMLVGADCDTAQWRRALASAADDLTAQQFVPQAVTSMPLLGDDGALVDEPVHVVGLLPGFDRELLGPGLCRASAESVINVAGGRGTLVPTMISTGDLT